MKFSPGKKSESALPILAGNLLQTAVSKKCKKQVPDKQQCVPDENGRGRRGGEGGGGRGEREEGGGGRGEGSYRDAWTYLKSQKKIHCCMPSGTCAFHAHAILLPPLMLTLFRGNGFFAPNCSLLSPYQVHFCEKEYGSGYCRSSLQIAERHLGYTFIV